MKSEERNLSSSLESVESGVSSGNSRSRSREKKNVSKVRKVEKAGKGMESKKGLIRLYQQLDSMKQSYLESIGYTD